MTNTPKNNNIGEEISVNISVTLGTADLRVQQLLKLGRGAVVELDRGINDYVDIYANVIIFRGVCHKKLSPQSFCVSSYIIFLFYQN